MISRCALPGARAVPQTPRRLVLRLLWTSRCDLKVCRSRRPRGPSNLYGRFSAYYGPRGVTSRCAFPGARAVLHTPPRLVLSLVGTSRCDFEVCLPGARAVPRTPPRPFAFLRRMWRCDVEVCLLRLVSCKTPPPGFVNKISHLSGSDRCEIQLDV